MRPEELGPPPFLISFGTGTGGGTWAAGASCNGMSEPWPQPIESVAANPARVARRMIRWSWNMNTPLVTAGLFSGPAARTPSGVARLTDPSDDRRKS